MCGENDCHEKIAYEERLKRLGIMTIDGRIITGTEIMIKGR